MDAGDVRWKVGSYEAAEDAARQLLDTLRVLREGGFEASHSPRMEEQARQKVVRLCGEIVRSVR